MRIHLKTTSSEETIPFNYQPLLTGALHKWLGKNEFHDDLSLYSFSWLQGGESNKYGLKFENGAYFFISAHDNSLIKSIIEGVQNDPFIANGLKVTEIIMQENPDFKEQQVFFAASPVLIKRTENDKINHYSFNNSISDKYLTETLKHKLREAGLSDNNLFVGFDRTSEKAKTKVIYYNNIGNKANLCPVIVKGTPEQLAFAWNVGVGNSTGSGFGAIK